MSLVHVSALLLPAVGSVIIWQSAQSLWNSSPWSVGLCTNQACYQITMQLRCGKDELGVVSSMQEVILTCTNSGGPGQFHIMRQGQDPASPDQVSHQGFATP